MSAPSPYEPSRRPTWPRSSTRCSDGSATVRSFLQGLRHATRVARGGVCSLRTVWPRAPDPDTLRVHHARQGGATMSKLEKLRPSGLHHNPAYSHVVAATGARTIYIAGQVSTDEEGRVVGEG